MGPKQRILAALHCQPVDRIPFTPLIGSFARGQMPTRYQRMPLWEFYAEFGIDPWIRNISAHATWPPQSFVPDSTMMPASLAVTMAKKNVVGKQRCGSVEIRNQRSGHESAVHVETPVGTLRSVWRNTPGSPHVPFCVEHMLKKVEDIQVFRYILDHTSVEPAYEDLRAAQGALGEQVVVDAYGHCTPVQDLIMFHMGLQEFVFMLQDHPEQVVGLLEQMLEIRKMEYRVLAQSPAEIIVTYENTSTTLLSPKYMAEYEFPALAEYSRILHAAGKLHLVHMCGRIQAVLPLIVESPIDGIVDIAPPPTGDCDFSVACAQLAAVGKCIAGGIDCTAFLGLSPEMLEAYVYDRLSQVTPGLGFLLGSGDAVPIGVPIENIVAVVSAVHEFGSTSLN